MPSKNEVVSILVQIPEELETQEEIQQYVANQVEEYVQASRVGEFRVSPRRTTGRINSRQPLAGTYIERREPPKNESTPTSDQEQLRKQLDAAEMNLSRLYQRYNMAASRIWGETRRKLLRRSISQERMRVELLQRQLRELSHAHHSG